MSLAAKIRLLAAVIKTFHHEEAMMYIDLMPTTVLMNGAICIQEGTVSPIVLVPILTIKTTMYRGMTRPAASFELRA